MGGEAELVPVLPAHRLDEAALARYLSRHLPGFDGEVQIRQFQGGQSNPTYHLATPAGQYVLRKKPPGKLLPRAHAVEREYQVISALADSDVPVPAARLLCTDETVIGTAFFVMDHVPGRVFPDRVLRDATPPSAPRPTPTWPAFWARCTGWIGARPGSPTSAGPTGIWSDRWRCGPGSGRRPAAKRCRRWTCWPNGCRGTCRPTPNPPASPTGTTGWVTCCCIRRSRAWSPCWIGSSRPSATRSPTWPTPA